jgi:hypothetical protein
LTKVRKEAKVAKVILDKMDPEASKSQKAQVKQDHEAKQALVKEQLAKMSENAGGCFSLYENLLSNNS